MSIAISVGVLAIVVPNISLVNSGCGRGRGAPPATGLGTATPCGGLLSAMLVIYGLKYSGTAGCGCGCTMSPSVPVGLYAGPPGCPKSLGSAVVAVDGVFCPKLLGSAVVAVGGGNKPVGGGGVMFDPRSPCVCIPPPLPVG